ncbi:MAG: fructose-1,6-bisphosphatase [DPANN group archaeon]|nr:fructose-1,6-bisphosphatase [DPANN group archaeon]
MELRQHLKKAGADEQLLELIMLLSRLSRKISAAFLTHQHRTSTRNIHGEEQMALDKYADKVFIEALEESRLVRTIASEEQDDILEIKKATGTFGVVMDPLDGSSLIDVNLTVGTIIGIYNEGDVLEPGSRMDAALYMLYGPLTSFVYTIGKGVHEFFLGDDGRFHLNRERIMIPEGKLIAPGALRKDWLGFHRKFISSLEDRGYKLRYSGSFVADVHQILFKGGLFTYPADRLHKQGKLRLLFEANPMGLLIEQAGGRISDGQENIRKKKPQSIADRTPLYIGDRKLIEEVEALPKDAA